MIDIQVQSLMISSDNYGRGQFEAFCSISSFGLKPRESIDSQVEKAPSSRADSAICSSISILDDLAMQFQGANRITA